MKKNVFSRAIAVLASMTVLGAASMMSANAGGVKGSSVEGAAGTTVDVPFSMFDNNSYGGTVTFSVDEPLKIVGVSGVMSSDPEGGDLSAGVSSVQAVYASGSALKDDFTTVKVEVPEGVDAGSYAVSVDIAELTEGLEGYAENPEGLAGEIVIPEEAPDPTPEPTPEPTPAPTTGAPAPTTAAPTTTTAAKKASPKTGSTGVAVAVAGLVTAGATAVVLKKKH